MTPHCSAVHPGSGVAQLLSRKMQSTQPYRGPCQAVHAAEVSAWGWSMCRRHLSTLTLC